MIERIFQFSNEPKNRIREFSSLKKIEMMGKHENMLNVIHMERNGNQNQL